MQNPYAKHLEVHWKESQGVGSWYQALFETWQRLGSDIEMPTIIEWKMHPNKAYDEAFWLSRRVELSHPASPKMGTIHS